MWQQLAITACLMLVLEGILPFLYPARWRKAVSAMAAVDDHKLRLMGLGSMILGVMVLSLIN
jgi:uncharacterized protein YjeT (DUF2065 family)